MNESLTGGQLDSDTAAAPVGVTIEPRCFADYFGSIDFRDRNLVGQDVDQDAINVATEAREMMDRIARWLTSCFNRQLIETHNMFADKLAAQIASDFGMVQCIECHRYDFEGVERCIHPGCGAPIIEYASPGGVGLRAQKGAGR